MFKKYFRIEYISLHEYKTCDLKYEIQPMTENFLFSHSTREIVGTNRGKKIVKFDIHVLNDIIRVTFTNILMNFEYVFRVLLKNYDEEEMMSYIDMVLKLNAANVRAEELNFW